MKKLLTKKLNYGKISPIGGIKAGGIKAGGIKAGGIKAGGIKAGGIKKLGVIVMLNKFGKKICAGVCALSLGFSSNVKSDALVWDAVVACAEFYTSFRLMQYRVLGPMLKMLKKQTALKLEINNAVKPAPKVGKTVSVLAGIISVILSIDAGKRVVNIVSSLKNDNKGEQKLDNEKATNKEQIESSKARMEYD